MLLARKGYKVLLVDKATFPSDTISTHLIHPPGIAALKRWGLLDRLLATGCPPIDTYAFDFGPFTLSGTPASGEASAAHSPRRTKLDKLLVDAASEAGAEVREGFTVDEVVTEAGRVTGVRGHSQDGRAGAEHARVVIGTDGRYSLVAAAVRPEQYNAKPPLQASYYSYWSGLPMSGRFETYLRADGAFAAWPTHDDLTLVIAGWPIAAFEANKKDIEGNVRKLIESAPPFADRIRAARREERFVGTAVPNYLRRPYGPGWELVGDAGYNKDFITAQGFRTPSGTPKPARGRWTRPSLEPAPSRWPWAGTRPRATHTSCRCTSSLASSRRSNPRRPRCSSCWRQRMATRQRWMGSLEPSPV